MKVVSILGSPQGRKGNTALILHPFLDGLKESGAEIDLFYTRDMKINPCLGDIGCWIRTPGTCIQKDDMGLVLPKLIEADLWVLATPVYMDGMTGQLKSCIDRMLPLAMPFMEVFEGHNFHLNREPSKNGKIVLVANSGFWELDNFDPLLAFTKAFCRNVRREFAGALLRPHGPAMRFVKNETLRKVFETAKQAGGEVARSGIISAETAAIVSQELISREDYIETINQGFRKLLPGTH